MLLILQLNEFTGVILLPISTHCQMEVYKTDFELERTARQEMASQMDQMSADLQLLQRRNQMLLDEAAATTEATSPAQYV